MEPFSIETLNSIAAARGIEYSPLDDPDPLTVRSRLAKAFPISQQSMFESFADPVAHVAMFPIIVASTPAIRSGLEGVLPENVFFAFEHVQESSLPARVMLVRYTLEAPRRIVKEAVTNPFEMAGGPLQDRKRGLVAMNFDAIGENETLLTTESTFQAESGSVFARGFIDRVWFNFFERMMFANGQIDETDFLT
ncbi:MAG: hypothetical protein E6G94_09315 [Alphaproteobacteria bacterium]|nr:MAG: hypothetical protein E6G94_09315 [Alphaproteobacteria bacterium]